VRFVPGEIIAGRYRLVALLGRGGMGEVYRAEDLTLEQPVALKFLPALGDLTQFHNELRLARQVSHKNVCRLYDIGEANGRRFLTMEYVDGEDLAALLRRIGRFPQDRALDLARQLCAGIAAAHERGIVHRDLKPANVMIDADGNVRITDFGIATAAADAGGVVAGTPQYMAPEQLAGRPATIKTDIYALGLILFEIFTGRRAHEAKSVADLKALHDTGTVATPSSFVRDLDPAIERAILRCLERDAERRPASALTVAAALPGGNPLGDALAAGETPSPELLVAAGETDAVSVRTAIALFATLLVSLVAYALVSPRATMAAMVPLDKPPAVLTDRAEQILAAFGRTEAAGDSATGFALPPDYPRWVVQSGEAGNRWSAEHKDTGPAVVFWYRSSPREMAPQRPAFTVSTSDPPLTTTDMALVILDTRGRLQELHVVPVQHETSTEPPPSPDWNAAFAAAGLTMASFAPVEPEWTPSSFADTRAAWEGPSPDHAADRLRVEAAAYRGRLVSFYLIGPWTRASRMTPLPQTTVAMTLGAVSALFWLVLLLGAAALARRNVRVNRADRRSAARLAVGYIVLEAAGWIVGNHHVSTVTLEASSIFKMLATAAFNGGGLWVLYLAIEPYGRRLWPDGLLGWTRLFSGHIRDPRVGRDVLIGGALGAALLMVDLFHQTPTLLGAAMAAPALGFGINSLTGPGMMILEWIQQTFNSVQSALLIVLVFVALRLLVRRTWLAVGIGIVIVAASSNNSVSGQALWLDAVFAVLGISLITYGIFRFGLLVTTVMLLTDNIPSSMPFAGHAAAWATMPGMLSAALIAALGCFGFYAARGGQPLFGDFDQ
jgi:serine/threonine-protein kinase